MSSLQINGVEVKTLQINGVEVKTLQINGVEVRIGDQDFYVLGGNARLILEPTWGLFTNHQNMNLDPAEFDMYIGANASNPHATFKSNFSVGFRVNSGVPSYNSPAARFVLGLQAPTTFDPAGDYLTYDSYTEYAFTFFTFNGFDSSTRTRGTITIQGEGLPIVIGVYGNMENGFSFGFLNSTTYITTVFGSNITITPYTVTAAGGAWWAPIPASVTAGDPYTTYKKTLYGTMADARITNYGQSLSLDGGVTWLYSTLYSEI